MHSVAKRLFDWISWVSARFCFQEGIRRFGYKSNLPNMAMVFLGNVCVQNKMTFLDYTVNQQNSYELQVSVTQPLLK